MPTKRYQSGRPELLKFINQEFVIRQIVKYGEISRADLARFTGLALPSIMRIVDALVVKGVVVEMGHGSSSGGRKPQMVALNKAYMWIIGLEIAGRSIVTLSDFSGKPIAAHTIDTRNDDTPEVTLIRLLEIVQALIAAHGVDPRNVALGVGTPGQGFKHSGQKKGFIAKGWEIIDVGAWFEARLEMPVFVDNVCRTRTLSEVWFGRGRVNPSFLYAFIDQGVGIGIVSEGVIVAGASGVAGEFGHTSIDRFGKPCYCGKNGCVEMYTSVGALGDEPSLSALTEAADALAFALGNVVNMLNPPLIVLGGMVPRSHEIFTSLVKARLAPNIFHNLATDTEVVLSAVDNESVCLGSIALVINHVLMSRA